MKKSKNLFGRLNNKVRGNPPLGWRGQVLILSKLIGSILVSFINGALQNDPVDESGWFSQVLAARKTAAEYTLLTKILLRAFVTLWLKICVVCETCGLAICG
jgi:hypothetical protein